MSEPGRSTHVQSVERAIDLLRAVTAAHGAGATAPALAEACGLTRATAWRVLKTLENQGMLTFDKGTNQYLIGPTAVEIGLAAGHRGLISLARPLLTEASRACGETAALAVVEADGLTYVDEVTAPSVLVASWMGRAVPLHATSTGKVLLAWSSAGARHLAERTLTRFTDSTITDPEALADELAAARAEGYARCRGELETTLYGVSAPILDLRGEPLAVVSLWGPQSRFTDDRMSELGPQVRHLAEAIGQRRLAGWNLPSAQ